jgi:hypothetical protein
MCLAAMASCSESVWTYCEPIIDPTNLTRFIKLDRPARSVSSTERRGSRSTKTDRGRSYAERAEHQGWGSCAAQVGRWGTFCCPKAGGVAGGP